MRPMVAVGLLDATAARDGVGDRTCGKGHATGHDRQAHEVPPVRLEEDGIARARLSGPGVRPAYP